MISLFVESVAFVVDVDVNAATGGADDVGVCDTNADAEYGAAVGDDDDGADDVVLARLAAVKLAALAVALTRGADAAADDVPLLLF